MYESIKIRNARQNSPKKDEISAALFIPFPFKRPSLDQQEWKTPKNKKFKKKMIEGEKVRKMNKTKHLCHQSSTQKKNKRMQ